MHAEFHDERRERETGTDGVREKPRQTLADYSCWQSWRAQYTHTHTSSANKEEKTRRDDCRNCIREALAARKLVLVCKNESP